MDNIRQRAFQKLRPPCVELSSVALRFRGRQTSVKSVLQALQGLHNVLAELGQANALDEKLAEYAFFPLQHIFNESQRLSSRCLEVAVNCLHILVSRGWRQNLMPEMGKQLLILLSLLAGGSPNQTGKEVPTEDLKTAAFDCMDVLIGCIKDVVPGHSTFDEIGSRKTVDQLAYLLIEAIIDGPSDEVQYAASKTLSTLLHSIESRVLLASLMPRTVSGLTKALQSSVRARRASRVLQCNLKLLTYILRRVLSDDVIDSDECGPALPRVSITSSHGESEEQTVLDRSWLMTTAAQVKVAMGSVVRLWHHDNHEVRRALFELCRVVVEECSKALASSAPVMVEGMLVLAEDQEQPSMMSTLQQLVVSYPHLSDVIKVKLHGWTTALPRIMQGRDDLPKERTLGQISTASQVLLYSGQPADSLVGSLASALVRSVAAAEHVAGRKPVEVVTEVPSLRVDSLATQNIAERSSFPPVVLDHRSQTGSLTALHSLLSNIQALGLSNNLARTLINVIPGSDAIDQLSSAWLALQLLREASSGLDDMIGLVAESHDSTHSRALLVSDLYSSTVSWLSYKSEDAQQIDGHLTAVALEILILQANQLGSAYRQELIDVLYPVLSLVGSSDQRVQRHAMTAVNRLARACEYSSAKDLLVENVDYLVNSIAIKLNTFDLSPQAPQVLIMMVQLCGASLLPYLDDLVDSIFAALDTFHGYPQLVEVLFEVLMAVVAESAKQPHLAITNGKLPGHRKSHQRPSTLNDILNDLRSLKSRKIVSDAVLGAELESAPSRPWGTPHDDQMGAANDEEAKDSPDNGEEDKSAEPPVSSHVDDNQPSLSKPHSLLLGIAQATAPHLSSPSVRVRHILLQLVNRIVPLLAQDENSFLPLVNTLWPVLVSKLFEELGTDGEGETAYNVCAAAEAMAKICEGAGDFLSGRIEDLLPSLRQMYKNLHRSHRLREETRSWPKTTDNDGDGSTNNTVDLQLALHESKAGQLASQPSSSVFQGVQTTNAQIINALLNLLKAIINHVRLTDDEGDALLQMLAPLQANGNREDMREALQTWNGDAVWHVQQRVKGL